jgi:DnaJ-class molecular chaperone
MGCFGSGRENGKIDPARPGCRACQGKGVHPIPWSELNNAECLECGGCGVLVTLLEGPMAGGEECDTCHGCKLEPIPWSELEQ